MPMDPHPEETTPKGEDVDIAEITRVSLAILDTGRHPVRRGQHPKQHGCVRGEFVVAPDVPEDLRVDLFAEPRAYPAWIRFSNGSQDDDAKGDIHGMAIKLLGVGGAKILDAERDEPTHDFVLMDHPVFFSHDAATNRALGQVMEQSTGPSLLRSLLRVLMPGADPARRRSAYIALRHFVLGGRFREFRALRAAVGKTPASPLRIAYWSATPYALGDRAVKYMARPVATDLPEPTDRTSPDRLRAALESHLDRAEARFEFCIQLRDPPGNPRLPVEDATTEWHESLAPFRKVATIVIPRQTFNTQERETFGENLSFTPWHALESHRPIGGINRARGIVYEALSERRHALNHVKRSEPDGQSAPASGSGT